MKTIQSDVIICGGGTAGLPAAVAAGRQGVRVCIIEEDERIGGAAVDQFVQSFCGHPVQGIYEELVQRMDAIAPEAKLPNAFRHSSYILAYLDMMADLPIEIYTRQRVRETEVRDGRITAVCTQDYRFEGAVFIDATGDGHVAAQAGCTVRFGREAASEFDEEFAPESADGFIQRCTLMFMVKHHPATTHKDIANRIAILNEDEFLIWGPTVYCTDPSDNQALAKAQDQALAMMPEQVEKWREKGFFVSSIAPKLGVRESRRIEGLHILSFRDIKEEHTHADSVCVVNYNIDPWDPDGNPQSNKERKKRTFMPFYEIPYRCLVNDTIDNLIVAGRCISSTHVANSSLRVMGICIPIGQAAGTGAALAVQNHCPTRSIDTDALRAILRAGGVHVSLSEFGQPVNPYL